MIWLIDDEPATTVPYVKALRASGQRVRSFSSATQVERVLRAGERPALVILDLMFPGDSRFRGSLFRHGLLGGMSLYTALRARFDDLPVVILTSFTSVETDGFFLQQSRCVLCRKSNTTPEQLVSFVQTLEGSKAKELLAQLDACAPGSEDASSFESVASAILEFLFVPPLERIIQQARRESGQDIRDVVIPNTAPLGFWREIRDEFDSRHVVVEFKNLRASVRQSEVTQLRKYLGRKSIGRFGLIVSRTGPSSSALVARRELYDEEPAFLVLFVGDADLRAMMALRTDGKDPTQILASQKETFEIAY